MKIKNIIFENTESHNDDELFGRSKGKKPLFTDEGLPKLDPNTQQRLLTATNSWLGMLPELSEWRELVDEAGEDTAEKIIADFVKFRDYVKQNNIVAAIGSIQQNAQDYDWDEAFQFYIENNTGIDIWDLMDIEDKNQNDAFSFYAGRRRLKENDESDDELFAYRDHKVVLVDGRAIDMQSIDLGDIMQSDYKTPNFVGAYVDSATFRDGTQLSNNELDQLKDVLVDQGMWETMIMNQIAEVGLYESDMSDDELFGNSSMLSGAAAKRIRKDDPEFSSVAVKINQLVRKLQNSSFDWDDLRRGSTLYNVLVNNDRALDEIIWELPDHVLERIIDELENLCDRYVKESELAESESDEPERKAKTQTKQKSRLNPDMFAPKADQPLAKTDPLDDIKRNAGTDKPEVNIKKASQADTLRKTSGISSPEMGDMLSRLRNIELGRDLEGYPDPEPPETLPSIEVNNKNLPAVAGEALQAAGVQNPDFHQVANLPGNMSDMIRQLGKSLFSALTMTPTKRIHVVANLGGQGPNTNQEVQAVAGFLKEHGEDLGPGDIDFDNVMPGYQAETHMFRAAGIRWMLVKDFAGSYIYCWPESDSLDASPALSHDTEERLKLR